MRILLADDSPAMRTMFRTVLERLGHQSRDIVDAKEGRDVMRALTNPGSPVDLIVFDWDLPGMDGLAFLNQVKALGLAETLSVLLSVNRQQRAMLPQAFRIATCDSIDRPFTEEQFEAKLKALAPSIAIKQAESSRRLRAVPAAPTPAEDDPGLPFLVLLPSAIMGDLLKLADERRHEAGAVLLKAGQVCDALHLVTRGQVDLLSGGKVVRSVGEGDPYGELSFMMSEPAAHTAQAKGAVVTASLSKARLSDLLRKHPSLDERLQALMARHKTVMTARATTIVQSDFKGTFDTMPFPNVIQILSIGRKSGVLGIRQEELSGGIYLDQGEAVHAWTETEQGEAAFFAIASWSKGKFAFNSVRREKERTLHKPTMTLLMDAMRRVEENAPAKDVGLDELFPTQ